MDRGRKILRSFWRSKPLTYGVLGVLMTAGYGQIAFAQDGQTVVSKTTPSNPPPAAVAPVPPPAPAPPAAPAQAAAAKPVSPIGSGAAWQTNVAQPPDAAAATVTMQDGDLQVVTKINDYFNKLTNLQGTFIQTDPDTKQKRGKFYFERPGKVRFDYGSPSRLKIISDGEYLAIEDHDLQTSDRYPLEMTPFRLLLAQTVDLGNDAKILGVEQGPDTTILTVEDKKGDGSGRIRLFFNRADMSLKEWIISDAQGLDTRIEVSNLEQNKQLAANLFEFSKTIGFKNAN
jgi:outer membrane lipoprotein-sorting protein